MGVIRVVSMAELHLSDAGQIEANWQSLSNEQLVSLAPSGRSLEQLKRELADGSRVILSDTPILPLFRYQSGEWITNIQEGISPHAVNQIQKRFASAGSSAHFKTSTGSLAPAIEPVYSPDPSLTQIAPTTAPTAKISPKFAQARRRLELELVYDDKEETAAGKVPYRVEFSDGSQKSGVLNAKGWACLEDCPNGEATVIFGDEAERQSAEQRLPDLYRQLAASLDTAAAEMAKKSEQLAAQADVQQVSDSFRQKVDAQLAELTAQREQFNQQQIWQQALQTGQAYTQGLSQGTASFMDDLLDFSGLMAFLEEAEISLSLLLEAIMTGDVDALEAKLAQWRARGENGLKATGEAMEMLILLLKDEYVRALLQSLPLRYLDAIPKDKLAEIAGYMHSRVSLDGMLEMSLVLLAALVGSVFGVILMFLLVTKKRANRIISPASSVLEDIAKAQKAVRNDHAVQTYIGKHQTPLNSKTPKGDVDTPLKSQENAGGDVLNTQKINPKTRLPRTNGKWDGEPGNGFWHSNIDEVNEITGGKPIEFVNGRPVFTPWAKGQVKFKLGQLDGSKADFDAVYEYVANQKGLSSLNAAKNYLKEAGLTPHHLDNVTIQFVPTKLHGNIPHIGSASDLRGGF
ncbi:hypothetical protein [Shewanella chilikensis]|uniref:hypothetical protein n=1 Tax=Shewanella chilikensis TaxID=558541 RepID=UPI00399BA3FE